MDATAARLIKEYRLKPHPEGGYFRESHRSSARIPAGALAAFPGARACSTAIFFLLPRGTRSRLHRLRSDEVWHFYDGGPLTLVSIAPSGGVETIALGRGPRQRLQHVVPAGHWFGARPAPDSAYSFVGCTVAPGFDFADFEMGRRRELLRRFPKARAAIAPLTEDD